MVKGGRREEEEGGRAARAWERKERNAKKEGHPPFIVGCLAGFKQSVASTWRSTPRAGDKIPAL